MKGNITYTMPTRGWVAIGNSIGAAEIAAWCGDDIQYGKSNVDDCLRSLADIQTGVDPDGYLGPGNAHDLCANREYVYLQCLFQPELKVLMTHAQARDALLKYSAFLDHGYRDAHNPPAPFEVEYIAEGKEAEAMAKRSGMIFLDIS